MDTAILQNKKSGPKLLGKASKVRRLAKETATDIPEKA